MKIKDCLYRNFQARLDINSILNVSKESKFLFASMFDFYDEKTFKYKQYKDNKIKLICTQWHYTNCLPVATIYPEKNGVNKVHIGKGFYETAVNILVLLLCVLFFILGIIFNLKEVIIFIAAFIVFYGALDTIIFYKNADYLQNLIIYFNEEDK